jgi:hypothetical protein
VSSRRQGQWDKAAACRLPAGSGTHPNHALIYMYRTQSGTSRHIAWQKVNDTHVPFTHLVGCEVWGCQWVGCR